jgi:hypothetical protein
MKQIGGRMNGLKGWAKAQRTGRRVAVSKWIGSHRKTLERSALQRAVLNRKLPVDAGGKL